MTACVTPLRQAGIRFQRAPLETVLDWADQAAPGDVAAAQHRRIALALDDDRLRKTQEIQALEREIAGRLAQTPYVLLLSFPGINVVSAADFAGEMGPIEHYANARAITGRAGLCPSRYQSDQVDNANGPLRRHATAAPRRHPGHRRQPHHVQPPLQRPGQQLGSRRARTRGTRRVKVGLRFCRIAFQMVAGRQVFRHPSLQGRHYILDKLIAFHREHDTPMAELLRDLQAAIEQCRARNTRRRPSRCTRSWRTIQAGRRRGPQLLGDILPIVLARLGVGRVQSTESGE